MNIDPESPDFRCPICGSNAATAVQVEGRRGTPFTLPSFQCAGCSIQFGDIRRFTRLMRHTYDREFRKVYESPTLGADDRPVPYWSPAAQQLKK